MQGLEHALSPWITGLLLGASLGVSVLGLLALPWLIRRLPEDLLIDVSTARRPGRSRRWMVVVLRNLLGAALMLAGIAMLVLPGQGLLTIVLAVFLMDLPYKRQLLVKLISFPRVLALLNAVRRRAGVAPIRPSNRR